MTVAMGNSTPRVKKAVEDAERVCPSESHKYGYLISFAQMLELELAGREKQLIECQHQLITRNSELFDATVRLQSASAHKEMP